MKKLIAIVVGLFLICFIAKALDVPNYDGYVNDFANVIDDSVEEELEERISSYEKTTTNEIAVITVLSLEGDSIEDFSIRLAEDWKVGKDDKDNGIILLFAVEDKRVRLEVGYGLEGVINDAKAGKILDDYVVEAHHAEDYTTAAKQGVEGIIQAIGEESWGEEMSGEVVSSLVLLLSLLGLIGMILFLVWITGGNDGSSYSGGFGSSGSGGGTSGGGGFGGGSFGGGGASR